MGDSDRFSCHFNLGVLYRNTGRLAESDKAPGLREVTSNSAADSLRRRPHARRNRSWTIITFSFAGVLCGRLDDLNKSANSAIALCAS